MVEKGGKFYFYVTVEHDDTHPGKVIGVAVGDSPTGPFVDARGSALVLDNKDTWRSWSDLDPMPQMARLTAMLDAFMRHRFGARSEKLDPDQLQLGLEDVETAVASAEAAAAAKGGSLSSARPRKRNRGALPAHLQRVEQVADVESKDCPCCDGALHRIGEDVAERLDVVPVVRSIRPLALNRKNALFAGSDEGRDNWAVIATLIEDCKLNSVGPRPHPGIHRHLHREITPRLRTLATLAAE